MYGFSKAQVCHAIRENLKKYCELLFTTTTTNKTGTWE